MTGIGITTTPKRKHLLDLCISQIAKHTGKHILFVHDDTEGKGVAYSKNQCLRALKDCDKIFLFDDDCFPIKDGWDEIFQGNHQTYLNNWGRIKQIKQIDHKIYYNNCAGVLMYMSKQAVETVGAFNENFGKYGFEHADYSNRIHLAGLTPYGKYCCSMDAPDYIHSLDYDGDFNGVSATPNFFPTELSKYLIEAQKVYKETPEIFIPL